MSGTFPRNSGPMLASPRCGARTRAGKPCSAPAVEGRTRCRMHGGAPESGAPTGNRNAVKHGLYTKAAIEERKQLRTLMRDARKLMHSIG
jgi:glucans biosynthesis protein